MLKRYSREEMACIWSMENRFQKMLEVEQAVATAQAQLGLIPDQVAQAIQDKGGFCMQKIEENEKSTRHDVTAFVHEVARQVGGGAGSFVHWGLTSSDVLDTALSLQIKEAFLVLDNSLSGLEKALWDQSWKHADTVCCGRTHGMWAEPITFGWKLMGFLAELRRHKERVKRAVQQAQIGKISGAVGTYLVLPKEVEQKVCQKLKLSPENVATQVVPRDRHAEVILSLSLLASGLERLAVEIRHLQKIEVGEVFENFVSGQTGSSAMPHKKNPIYSENITGLSRLLRSYVSPVLENIVLWHERDISHSSVERVIFPSAFTLCDFALVRMTQVIQYLQVDKQSMQNNLQSSRGVVFSSLILKQLISKGLDRSSAYSLIQSLSMSLAGDEHLQDTVLKNKTVLKYLSPNEVKKIFSLPEKQEYIANQVKDFLNTIK